MSIIERIRTKQGEAIKNWEASRVVNEQSNREAAEEMDKTCKEKEAQYKIKRDSMLSECGVPALLQQIEQEFLKHQYHQLSVRQDKVRVTPTASDDDDRFHDRVEYLLAWGYQKSQEQKTEISGYDYNSIKVYVDLDNGKIDIYAGEKTSFEDKSRWQDDKSVIEEALADAFFHPNRNKYHEPSPSGWF